MNSMNMFEFFYSKDGIDDQEKISNLQGMKLDRHFVS